MSLNKITNVDSENVAVLHSNPSGSGGSANSFQARIEYMFESISKDVSSSKKENEAINKHMKKIENDLTTGFITIKNEVTKLRKECNSLKKKNAQLTQRLENVNSLFDEIHYFVKFNKIRILNVPYKENENPLNLISVISNKIGFHFDYSKFDGCFRILNRVSNRHPVIILNFIKNSDMREFINLAKSKRDLLKSSMFQDISEDNQTSVLIFEEMGKHSYRLFKRGRDLKKLGKLKHIWYNNGRVLARKEDGSKVVLIKSYTDFMVFDSDNRRARDTSESNEEETDVEVAYDTDKSTLSQQSIVKLDRKRKFKHVKSHRIETFLKPKKPASDAKNE